MIKRCGAGSSSKSYVMITQGREELTRTGGRAVDEGLARKRIGKRYLSYNPSPPLSRATGCCNKAPLLRIQAAYNWILPVRAILLRVNREAGEQDLGLGG